MSVEKDSPVSQVKNENNVAGRIVSADVATGYGTDVHAFFIPSFRGGGAEKVVIEIANWLASKGMNIHLVVASAHGPYAGIVSERVQVQDLGQPSIFRSIPFLCAYLYRVRPNSVLSTMLHVNLAVAISSTLTLFKGRIIAREALPLTIEMDQSRVISWLTRLFYRRFDAFVSMTNCQQNIRRQSVYVGSKSDEFVIPNPVDFVSIEADRLKNPEVAIPALFKNLPLIVACGRFSEQKGFDILLRAFAEARKTHSCALAILGDGEQRSRLLTLANDLGVSEWVWMPGFVDNPHPYTRLASMFVSSSWHEGMPNALLHAYAFGTRCIATDCECGPAEIFQNSGTSILVEPGNFREMGAAIVMTLSGPEKEDELQDWVSLYSIEQVGNAYLKALKVENVE